MYTLRYQVTIDNKNMPTVFPDLMSFAKELLFKGLNRDFSYI